MKLINTMIKPAYETHKRILNPIFEMSHRPTDDISEIVALRDANADSVIVVSRKAAYELKDSTFNLTSIYYLVDKPDQETINQVFPQLFRPVSALRD